MEKISFDRRAYESVDDKSLTRKRSWVVMGQFLLNSPLRSLSIQIYYLVFIYLVEKFFHINLTEHQK